MSTESQRIGLEVIGQYTEFQKQEITFLGLHVMQARKLDTNKPEDVEEATFIIEDCLRRGLEAKNRVWFTPQESVAPFFDEGITQRERIITDLTQEVQVSEESHSYTTDDERHQAEQLIKAGAFTTEIEEAERLLQTIKSRKESVKNFQNLLFDTPKLKQEARELNRIARMQENPVPQTLDTINNRLFNNLLLNIAISNTLNINADPRDLAALSEIWEDEDTLKSAQNRILTVIRNAAKQVGIDEVGVDLYTSNQLSTLSNYATGKLSLTNLIEAASTDFVFKTEDLDEIELELRTNTSEHTPIEVSQEEVKVAREKISHIYSMNEEFFETDDEDLSNEKYEEIRSQFQTLTPLELLILIDDFKNGRNKDLNEEIISMPSFETYIEAFKLTFAPKIIVRETGETINNFEKNSLELVLRQFIKTKILEDLDKENISISEYGSKIPAGLLLDFIQKGTVSPRQKAELLDLGDEVWAAICREDDFQFSSELAGNRELLRVLENEEADLVTGYLRNMTEEKAVRILLSLQRNVEL